MSVIDPLGENIDVPTKITPSARYRKVKVPRLKGYDDYGNRHLPDVELIQLGHNESIVSIYPLLVLEGYVELEALIEMKISLDNLYRIDDPVHDDGFANYDDFLRD